MKQFLFSLALLAGASLTNAQITIFEDDFESYDDFLIDGIGDWVMIDIDGSDTYSYTGEALFDNAYEAKAFMVFNPFTAEPFPENSVGGEENRNFDPIDAGDKYLGAWASVNGPNNDWMISPAITLGTSNNVLEFDHKSLSDTYGYEKFSVYIYEGSGVPALDQFTALDSNLTSNSWMTWLHYSKNLDAYAGKTVRIAIQCVSDDAYMFMVDNFKVTADALASVSDANAKNISTIYPNPVVDTFKVNLSSKFGSNLSVTINDMTGKVVKTFEGVSTYNVSELPAGVYVVKITDGKNTETKKIVKK